MSGAATFTVNGAERSATALTSVAALVAAEGAPERGTAVAVNGAVVPRGRWAATMLHDGDAVEILTAVQGG